MAQVRFEGVHKAFGSTRVIEGLDLTVADGEFFTFVGPSGCGKSTILNMIAGLEHPTNGTIYFDDQPINRVPTRDRDVAMVFQSYALYPHMKVFDNIAFPLKMRKTPKEQTRIEVEQTATILGIEELLQRKPRELSGGQRQRVAVARAIIRQPRVFLMDEPLSNLDAKLRIGMRAELKQLHQRLKTTTIYVTHDQEEAMGLSQRIAVLSGGRVQQCGTPDEVYARPANMFVAGFLGSPPMNFLRGELVSTDPMNVVVNGAAFYPTAEKTPSGKSVVLGIRPDDLLLSCERDNFEGQVLTAEFIGSGSWIELQWQDSQMKGFMSADTPVAPGQSVFFDIPIEKCYVFDQRTGERL
jgi:multiple sugar transport system ATP-binding protein